MIDSEKKKQRKITRVFLMMSIIYTATILPAVIGQLVVDSIVMENYMIGIIKSSLNIFYLLSSVINPLLTLKFKPDFSKSLLGKQEKVADQNGSMTESTSSSWKRSDKSGFQTGNVEYV